MHALVRFFIRYPIAGDLLMVLFLLAGAFGLTNLKSTFFPEVESRIITIQTIYPGASPEEIEEGIILKIEENLKGVSGVERVSSVSTENSGVITVEALQGYDPEKVLDDVRNAVDRIPSFPVGMEPAVVFRQENLGFAINFAISGNVDLQTLKQFARQAETELLAIDGISKITLNGFPDEEIEIAFREKDLLAYQLTFAEAEQAIRGSNLELTGGTVKGKQEELLIRARNKRYYADELRDIPIVVTTDGNIIRLYQIADIQDKWSDNPDRSWINDKPSVVVTVSNTLEEDILDISEKVRAYILSFNDQQSLVHADIIRDGSVVLQQRIDLLANNGMIGFILVLGLLSMFLNWRLAFWVALSIPISFAGMFLVAYLMDITINVISLFGMIVVVGILVDDGIVIAENIYQLYERGVPRYKAALEGSLKVIPAVFTSVLTTIIAFSSFAFLDGRIGDIFTVLGVVVILSLFFSLVEGIFILPGHVAHSVALQPNQKKNKVQKVFEGLMLWLRNRLYAPFLRFSLRYPASTIIVYTVLLILTVGMIRGGLVKTTFFPVIPRDNISVTLKMPAGTREYVTRDVLHRIQLAAEEVNNRFAASYFQGANQPINHIELKIGPTTYQGSVDISLLDGEIRDSLTATVITNAIRELVGEVPEAEVLTFGQPSPFGKPISVSLLGNDFGSLRSAVTDLQTELESLSELRDVTNNNQEGLREINITLKEKAKGLGLQLRDVITQVRQGYFGVEVQRLQRGEDEVRVWVRYGEEDRDDLSQLKEMRIRFPDGRAFPLREIVDLEVKRGIIAINHLDGQREIKVEADVAQDNVSVTDLNESIRSNIVPQVLANYPTVSASFEGQNREQMKTAHSARMVLPVMLLLMFFTVAVTFRSIGQTLAVFALIPFGLAGVGLGHWVMDLPISLFSFLGIMALVGIQVNDGLVLITTYNDLIRKGNRVMRSIYTAALSRFRPILLTSLTTVAGLGPLLLEKSFQAKFLIPMAVSVAFGLILATFLTLTLLPAFLMIINRVKLFAVTQWEGFRPDPRSIEPAIEGRKNYIWLWLFFATMIVFLFLALIYFSIRLSDILIPS
ncbi:MAG: efflux RND transporter permease subunit [Saprospiraceae bacterium]|nr:efflux RND transporter permease subunit [Saprospiraceae bacterium]